MTKKLKTIYLILIALTLISFDQWSKTAIKNHFGVEHHENGLSMKVYDNIQIIGSFIEFTYVENEGMAFGISFGAGKFFLSIFSILASIGLMIYLIKLYPFHNWVRLAITFIFAGAVGNLIDRVFYGLFYNYSVIFYGKVIDFVQVDIPDIHFLGLNYTHFPVFNVADSCVTVGVTILILFHKYIPTYREVFPKKINVTSE